jgi:hypothetical protein
LANLIGQDFRDFRTDVQQRMAAISGLDAAKPNFAGDNTPANWNGILFFATDTGKIYQFNNPTWTDVTSNFNNGVRRIGQDATQIVHTGTTSLDDIYTIPVPSWAPGNSIRLKYHFVMNLQAGVATNVKVFSQGHGTLLSAFQFTNGGPIVGTFNECEILICNGASNNGIAVSQRLVGGSPGNDLTVPILFTGLALTSLIVSVQNGTSTDRQSFGPMLAEFVP